MTQAVDSTSRAMDCSARWLALVTRARHEKFAQSILESKGYRTSLPLQCLTHKRRAGSSWNSYLPLIPGYVFLAVDRNNPCPIMTTPGVLKIVSFGRHPGIIPEGEIEALERVAASGLAVTECPAVKLGEAVEIIEGPLKGMRGTVLRTTGATRLVTGIQLLQRSVAVDIDAAWVRPAGQYLPN